MMFAFKAGPGRFEQLRKNLRMKPLIFLMYLILTASVIPSVGLQLEVCILVSEQ